MEKQRQGKSWKFNYHKLSYKQKFTRILWEIPIILFAIAFLWRYSSDFTMNMFITFFVIIIVIVQTTYIYLKCQKEIL